MAWSSLSTLGVHKTAWVSFRVENVVVCTLHTGFKSTVQEELPDTYLQEHWPANEQTGALDLNS